MNFAEFTSHFEGPKNGKYRCPVHDGYSLSLSEGEKHYLVHCFGCDATYKEIMSAAGLSRVKQERPELRIKQKKKLTVNDLENVKDWFATSWNEADKVSSHPYLERKQVGAYGIKQCGSVLLLPMYNSKNKLAGLQSIFPDGRKRTWGNSAMKGAFFFLTPRWPKASHVWLAEGYATAATMLEVAHSLEASIPVVCCYSAANLPLVTEILQATNARQEIYIAIDNDKSGTGFKCSELARDAGADYGTMPDERGDWNDYRVKYGIKMTADEIYGY